MCDGLSLKVRAALQLRGSTCWLLAADQCGAGHKRAIRGTQGRGLARDAVHDQGAAAQDPGARGGGRHQARRHRQAPSREQQVRAVQPAACRVALHRSILQKILQWDTSECRAHALHGKGAAAKDSVRMEEAVTKLGGSVKRPPRDQQVRCIGAWQDPRDIDRAARHGVDEFCGEGRPASLGTPQIAL